MSYYWFNKQEMLEKSKINIIIKVVKKKLLSIIKKKEIIKKSKKQI